MISLGHQPRAITNNDQDFTAAHYRQLLRLAKRGYRFVGYEDIPFGQRFLLWRHDVDYSLNRALALAHIEYEEGVCATYFVNPHSEFYNLSERSQVDFAHLLMDLGHDIGLHFDSVYYTSSDEAELECQLSVDAELVERILGVRPKAFSFHNPSSFHLSCDAEHYVDMVNCYSRRFKSEVPYCSDSNGYWRFRRLYDVLEQASDHCLQVLTHPGWWQEYPLSPRQRVFRSVYGRADATIRFFDNAIETGGRENPAGPPKELAFLRETNPNGYMLCDFLMSLRHYPTLFLELWRLFELQVNRLCKIEFHIGWGIEADEIDLFFDTDRQRIQGWKLFDMTFKGSWQAVCGEGGAEDMVYYASLKDALLLGQDLPTGTNLHHACTGLCRVMEALANWGRMRDPSCDGLALLDITNIKTQVKRLRDVNAGRVVSSVCEWHDFLAELA
jgi:hypothetical protein